MLPLIGSLIGAGASLIGGFMNNNAQQQANQANIASTEAANAANIAASQEANQKNYEAQKEFAQNGLRWKVADANAAGIHPVYAMGAQPMNFAPSFVGSNSMASTSLSGNPGDGVAAAGQDIGRAIAATETNEERALRALTLERAGLENDLLRTQIRRQVMETGPSFPDAGGTDTSLAILKHLFGNVPLGPHSSASDVQNEYGEVVGDVHGIGRWIHDMSSAAANHLANMPNRRPARLPGEPNRPAPGPANAHLGSNYNRPRRAPF